MWVQYWISSTCTIFAFFSTFSMFRISLYTSIVQNYTWSLLVCFNLLRKHFSFLFWYSFISQTKILRRNLLRRLGRKVASRRFEKTTLTLFFTLIMFLVLSLLGKFGGILVIKGWLNRSRINSWDLVSFQIYIHSQSYFRFEALLIQLVPTSTFLNHFIIFRFWFD